MSPRPKKPRQCGCDAAGRSFKPTGVPLARLERVPIQRDEIEVLKLCDLDGLSQEQAGKKMGVSRGTVQRILAAARRKTADALSGCKALVLEDGICGDRRKNGGVPT